VRGKSSSQSVTARRAFAGKFVELQVTDGTPHIDGRPYEAAYFIGVSGEGRFVMNLVEQGVEEPFATKRMERR
jgi:hypothetical protein